MAFVNNQDNQNEQITSLKNRLYKEIKGVEYLLWGHLFDDETSPVGFLFRSYRVVVDKGVLNYKETQKLNFDKHRERTQKLFNDLKNVEGALDQDEIYRFEKILANEFKIFEKEQGTFGWENSRFMYCDEFIPLQKELKKISDCLSIMKGQKGERFEWTESFVEKFEKKFDELKELLITQEKIKDWISKGYVPRLVTNGGFLERSLTIAENDFNNDE